MPAVFDGSFDRPESLMYMIQPDFKSWPVCKPFNQIINWLAGFKTGSVCKKSGSGSISQCAWSKSGPTYAVDGLALAVNGHIDQLPSHVQITVWPAFKTICLASCKPFSQRFKPSVCCSSVAEHWQLKPEVSWVQLPETADFFTFLYFHLVISKNKIHLLSLSNSRRPQTVTIVGSLVWNKCRPRIVAVASIRTTCTCMWIADDGHKLALELSVL